MPGPPPKLVGKQRRNKPTNVATVTRLIPRDVSEIPAPSDRWRASIVESWTVAWTSELGAYWLTSTDFPIIFRLFDLRDRLAAVDDQLDEDGLLSVGSKGQLVAHPLLAVAATLRGDIRNLEDRCGLSPVWRNKLGVKVGEAAKSLDDMNRRLTRGTPTLDAGEEEDPRNVIDLGNAG